jgi:GxxExxY protein
MLVADRVVIELKALHTETSVVHVSQILSYLRATQRDVGLLINFGLPTIKQGLKRVVLAPRVSSNSF